jgi:hypothetical protein
MYNEDRTGEGNEERRKRRKGERATKVERRPEMR